MSSFHVPAVGVRGLENSKYYVVYSKYYIYVYVVLETPKTEAARVQIDSIFPKSTHRNPSSEMCRLKPSRDRIFSPGPGAIDQISSKPQCKEELQSRHDHLAAHQSIANRAGSAPARRSAERKVPREVVCDLIGPVIWGTRTGIVYIPLLELTWKWKPLGCRGKWSSKQGLPFQWVQRAMN